MLNYYLVYEFLKRLSRPFTEWDAFKAGVIDKDGKILVKKRDRDSKQKQSFTPVDNLVRNIRTYLMKLPGGAGRLASWAAVLYLIKEHNMFKEGNNVLNESEIPQVDIDAVGRYVTEVVNSAMGIDSTGFMSVEQQKKWKKKNAESISSEFR